MSKYTTELRFICETAAGLSESKGFNNVDGIIEAARKKIFDFEYPIFDEDYRQTLETKILKHFYTREIGSETVGRWRLWLDATMNEIMPFYNKLYTDGLSIINPLQDVDMTEKKEAETTHTSSGSSVLSKDMKTLERGTDMTTQEGSITDEGTYSSNRDIDKDGYTQSSNKDTRTHSDDMVHTHWDLYSDTPQNGLTGVDNLDYLTNARKTTDSVAAGGQVTDTTTYGKRDQYHEIVNDDVKNGKSDNTRTMNTRDSLIKNSDTYEKGTDSTTTSDSGGGTENYLIRRYGRSGGVNVLEVIQQMQDTFMDIDRMVIRDLEPLFMHLW